MGKDKSFDDVINRAVERAVERAIAAGRAQGINAPKDAYKATERRLYALSILRGKVSVDRAKLAALESGDKQARSKCIVRYSRTGYRASPEEILDAMTQDMRAETAADEHEIETIETALSTIAADPYYMTVYGRYVLSLSDDDIAAEIPCDPATVWRNRKRLVQRLAVYLYGAAAL